MLKKEVVIQGNDRIIYLAGRPFDYDEKFEIFLTTTERAPHFDIEVSAMSTIVNFMVTLEGLQAQMLSVVVSTEKPELEG